MSSFSAMMPLIELFCVTLEQCHIVPTAECLSSNLSHTTKFTAMQDPHSLGQLLYVLLNSAATVQARCR